MAKYNVGDKVMLQLWSSPPRQAEVTKVGRRWVTVDGAARQFDGETGEMKGPYHGWIATLDEYGAMVREQELRLHMVRTHGVSPPVSLNADQLERILAILEETR